MGAMSTPEPIVPSRRLRSAAEAERERLGRDLERLDRRADKLQAELTTIERQRSEIRDQLALLARLAWNPEESPFATPRTAGKASHLQAVPPDGGPPPRALLRGARIREIAVLLLASSANPTRPIHYQQWYRLLRDAGYGIDAQDPLATFLTQVTRSPVVRRADAPGVYALDLDAPRVLGDRLQQLEQRLRRPAPEQASLDDVAQARDERATIVRSIRTTERQVEEALRSLGNGPAERG